MCGVFSTETGNSFAAGVGFAAVAPPRRRPRIFKLGYAPRAGFALHCSPGPIIKFTADFCLHKWGPSPDEGLSPINKGKSTAGRSHRLTSGGEAVACSGDEI